MATDRELLEMAAKAAGIPANMWAEPGELISDKGGWVQFIGYGQASVWNPLTDDGDALRLAVNLRMRVAFPESSTTAQVPSTVIASAPRGLAFMDVLGTNPCAATRLVIVRAAAAIGKAMP